MEGDVDVDDEDEGGGVVGEEEMVAGRGLATTRSNQDQEP